VKAFVTVMLSIGLSLAAIASAHATSDDALAPQQQALDLERANLNALLQDAGAGVRAGMLDEARAVVDDPSFSSLESDAQYRGLLILGSALHANRQNTEAHAIAVRLTSMADADGQAWRLRLVSAPIGDQTERLPCLARIAQNWPDQLANIDPSYIARSIVTTDNEPALADLRFQLLQALWANHWPGAQSILPPSEVWLALAEAYEGRGDTAHALLVSGSVIDPNVLIDVQIDRRYDRLKAAMGDQFDLAKAQLHYLDALKAAAASLPNQLGVVALLVAELGDENRIGEASGVLDAAVAKIKADTPDHPAYQNEAQQRLWMDDRRSTLLLLSGHVDAAVAEKTLAAGLQEDGQPNVSQAINLGDLLIGLNRPKAALAAVAGLTDDNASPFGRMQLWNVRACADAELKDDADYQAELKKLRDHEADAPGALEQVLICANDLDGAAAVLIDRLGEADQRLEALREVQTYLQPAVELTMGRELDRREEKVAQRPAVRAAIDAVGHVTTISRLAPGWF